VVVEQVSNGDIIGVDVRETQPSQLCVL